MDTFGLTGVDIEYRPLKVIPEKRQKRIQSQHSLRSTAKEKLLPKISQTEQKPLKSTQKLRSLSEQKLPLSADKKLQNLRRILEQNRNCNSQQQNTRKLPMPKSSSSFLLQYNQKIKSDLEVLYTSNDMSKIISNLKGQDKKSALNYHLEKNQKVIQKEMNLSNQIFHEVNQKEKQLEKLQQQIKLIEMQIKNTIQEQENVENSIKQSQDLENQLFENLEYEKTLQFMMKQRQKIVTFTKGQINKQMFYLRHLKEQSSIVNKQYVMDSIKVRKNNLELNNLFEEGPITMENMPINTNFELLLEKELAEFENQKAIQELFRQEKEIQRQILGEKKKNKEYLMQKKRESQQEIEQRLDREHKKVNYELEREQREFDKLRRVTQKSEIKDLKNHNKELKDRRLNLNKMKEDYTQKISIEQKEIQELQSKLKKLKYETRKDSIQQIQLKQQQSFTENQIDDNQQENQNNEILQQNSENQQQNNENQQENNENQQQNNENQQENQIQQQNDNVQIQKKQSLQRNNSSQSSLSKRKNQILQSRYDPLNEKLQFQSIDYQENVKRQELESLKIIEETYKKSVMIVDDFCLMTSKILYQLNNNNLEDEIQIQNQEEEDQQDQIQLLDVKKQNLPEAISKIMLCLEKIQGQVQHLIENQNNQNIEINKLESVNTDMNIVQPPQYLGLNSKIAKINPNQNNSQSQGYDSFFESNNQQLTNNNNSKVNINDSIQESSTDQPNLEREMYKLKRFQQLQEKQNYISMNSKKSDNIQNKKIMQIKKKKNSFIQEEQENINELEKQAQILKNKYEQQIQQNKLLQQQKLEEEERKKFFN